MVLDHMLWTTTLEKVSYPQGSYSRYWHCKWTILLSALSLPPQFWLPTLPPFFTLPLSIINEDCSSSCFPAKRIVSFEFAHLDLMLDSYVWHGGVVLQCSPCQLGSRSWHLPSCRSGSPWWLMLPMLHQRQLVVWVVVLLCGKGPSQKRWNKVPPGSNWILLQVSYDCDDHFCYYSAEEKWNTKVETKGLC